MPDATHEKEVQSIVFHGNWTDTTRHGYMKDYKASPVPVSLPLNIAQAAIADGKASPEGEGESFQPEGEPDAD